MADPAKKAPVASMLDVLVVPRASASEIVGWHEGRLRVRLKAPPVDGEANAELVRTLAKALSVPKSAVSLSGGQTSKRKTIRIEGLLPETLAALLPPRQP